MLLTGSVAGNQPVPWSATYVATKAFVNSLAEALHAELRGTGVACTLLAPGPVASGFAEAAGVSYAARRLPRRSWVTPDETARAGLRGLARNRRRVTPGLSARTPRRPPATPRALAAPA